MLELHLDPLGGIAGDMFAAALLDLRPDLEVDLRQALTLCPLIEDVSFRLDAHNDGVLTGRQFLVSRGGQPDVPPVHSRDHGHDHEHDHSHDAPLGHHDHHHHTDWRSIREALVTSKLDRDTVRHAVGIFSLLAEAEGKVHGMPAEDVSFHEVGAWDSIADIVAAAFLISRVGAARWSVGALPLGSGRVRTAHGLLPVPAPATSLLLEGFLTIDDGIGGERVTPTGAAILRYLCEPDTSHISPRKLMGSSHGFGTRRLRGLSNCLRLLAFETVEAAIGINDVVAVLECEIDDQSGEDLAHAVDRLRAQAGVLDVIQAPVFGKKGRMMTHLRILADPQALDAILATAFDETTTIGIRHSLVRRTVLPRTETIKDIDGRSLRIKIVDRPTGQTAKLEADDLADVAGHRHRDGLRRLVDDPPARDGKEPS